MLESDLSFKEAVFLSKLPYRQSFYRRGGWQQSKGPGSPEWDSFLKEFFLARELRKAREEAQAYPKEMKLKLEGLLFPVKTLSFWHSAYPHPLAHIYDPPPVLFLWGAPCLDYGEYLAVVGTRRANPLCKRAVHLFLEKKKREFLQKTSIASPTTPKEGLCIVSGLANGVDTLAHQSALAQGLGNIAVLGAGFFHAGPRANLGMIREADKKGLPFTLLSEFSPKTAGYSAHFPRRNRIIAGLCSTLALIQAPRRSGALITARYAIEEGRELLVFDHPFFDSLPASNYGGRRLLEAGAEKIVLAELETKLVKRPPESWRVNQEQLSFWKTKLEGAEWLGGSYYLKK